jgi:uncharacterized protein (TIGR03118 family)
MLASVLVAGCGGDDNDGGGSNNPATVTLSAAPTTITLGDSTTLTWSSNSGTACTASGAWSGSKSNSGTESVTPTATGAVTYTLACSGGPYDSGTASVTVTVEAGTSFTKTVLVADTAGVGAVTTDTNLVNPWGLAFGPTTPAWVANAGTSTSTVYNGSGRPRPTGTPRIVHLPDPAAGAEFEPTGTVYNGTTDFVVTQGTASAPATFIFAGEGGAIAGWSSTVDAANAVVTYVSDESGSYTGLALASDGGANYLYAADFANGEIVVFNASFVEQTPTATDFAFTDPNLPADYYPFNVQALPTGTGGAMQLYVAYAKRDSGGDEQVGAGLGVVNVFSTHGDFVRRLVDDGGSLDAPWGFALAPDGLGTFSGAVLVGNFGDGRIHAFDVATGEPMGTVSNSSGTPIATPGLWGIAFGNDTNNQPSDTLFYAAGTNDEANGEFGRIDLGDAPPVLDTPPEAVLTAPPAGDVSGTVTVSATATGSAAVASVEFLAGTTSLGTDTSSPYSVQWDTTQMADGAVQLTARATDVDGLVGTSPAVSVTIANDAPAATTLTELQTLVFTPICSVCHNGSGGGLPGSQDLRAGQTYASLVNVPSIQKPALMRVKPGDSANSYLVHKLQGSPDIEGTRMPQGGPFLDQATMDKVRSWIDSGAPNN